MFNMASLFNFNIFCEFRKESYPPLYLELNVHKLHTVLGIRYNDLLYNSAILGHAFLIPPERTIESAKSNSLFVQVYGRLTKLNFEFLFFLFVPNWRWTNISSRSQWDTHRLLCKPCAKSRHQTTMFLFERCDIIICR